MLAGAVKAQSSLVINSWRSDDLAIWNSVLIPAIERRFPEISLSFSAELPEEYDEALRAKLSEGVAGDIVSCRPYDVSRELFRDGYLQELTGDQILDPYQSDALDAWTDRDGSVFCMPLVSVVQGFIYNREIFDELGLAPPDTELEFFEVLEAIRRDGRYIPLAIGTSDMWEAATMGYHGIGPTYWRGEVGRRSLLDGSARLTDPEFVIPFQVLARWGGYLAPGHETQRYADSQHMFTRGRAAIYPAGSWEIAGFNQLAPFKMGAFPPPRSREGAPCYVTNHLDMGFGINANSRSQEEAKKLLRWMSTEEFAQLLADQLDGFFPLSDDDITIYDPVAREFASWRDECETTIRLSSEAVSSGKRPLEDLLWNASADAMRGRRTPQEIAQDTQRALESWYFPPR